MADMKFSAEDFSRTGSFPEEDFIRPAPKVQLGEQEVKDKSFYGAALSGDQGIEDKVTIYQKIKKDLESEGTSPILQDVERLLSYEQNTTRRSAITDIMSDPDISVEEKQDIVRGYLAQEAGDISLEEQYLSKVAATTNATTASELSQEEVDFSWVAERQRKLAGVQQDAKKALARMSTGEVDRVVSVAQVMLPFLEQIGLATIGPEEKSLWDNVVDFLMFGSHKQEIRQHLEGLPIDKQVEAKRLLIKEIETLPGGDMPKAWLLGDLIQDPEYTDAWAIVDNIIGILDFVGVGHLIGSTVKTGVEGVEATSILGKTVIANQEEGGKLAVSTVLDETGEIAGAVGTTREGVVQEYGLPKAVDTALTGAPDSLLEKINRIEAIDKRIRSETDTHGINYYEADKVTARANTDSLLEKVSTAKIHSGKSVLKDDGERYIVQAMYGKTEDRGFATLEEAMTAIPRNVDFEASIYAKDPKTGEILRAEKVTDGNEFFFNLKIDHIYNPMDASVLGLDGVQSVSRFGRGKLGGYLQDVVSRFDRRISTSAVKAPDLASFAEQALLKPIKKTLMKLPRKSKVRVYQLLEEGSKRETVFKYADLAGKYTEKEIEAYYTYRKVLDIEWGFSNREYRKSLIRDNWVDEIQINNAENKTFGRMIKEDSELLKKDKLYAFDPESGTVVELSREDMAALYAKNIQLAEVKGGFKVAGDKTSYAIVDGMSAIAKPLGQSPLPYIEGYYQRSYNAYFYLDRVPTSLRINGEVADQKQLADNADTIRAFESGSDAAEAAKKMNRDLIGTEDEGKYTFVSRTASEFEDNSVKDYDTYLSSLKAAKSRGQWLTTTGDELSEIEDPIESLLRTTRTLANKIAMDDLIAAEKNRFMNTYGERLGLTEFPVGVDLRTTKAFAKDPGDFGEAVAFLQHIRLLERTPAKTSLLWRNLMFKVAESLDGERHAFKTLGLLARKAGERSPIDGIRRIPQIAFIALRPVRQIMIQSGQLAQFAFMDPKYVASGAMIKDVSAITMALAAKGSKGEDLAFNTAAKMMGMSRKDFNVVYSQYVEKSGLPQSVDSQLLVEGMVRTTHESVFKSPLTNLASAPIRAAKAVVKASKFAGFDAGEYTNLTGTWLFARRRWMKNNPKIAHKWADKTNADIIAAEARELSYAMNQGGAFAYQKGILAAPMQFVAITHKAVLSMLPAKMGGSKILNNSEKGRVIAANMFLFGSYGMGISTLLDKAKDESGLDIPEPLWLSLKGGMIDLAGNSLMSTMWDEKDDGIRVQFSKSFAPMADNIFPATGTLNALIDNDFFTAAFGPSANILHPETGRIARAARRVKMISDRPDLETDDKVLRVLSEVAEVASGYSDWTKYRIWKNTGRIVSKRGSTTIENAWSGSMAALAGLSTYNEDDMWRNLRSIGEDKAELKKTVEQYYEDAMAIQQKYEGNPAEFKLRMERHNQILMAFTPEELSEVESYLQFLDNKSLLTTQDSYTARIVRDGLNSTKRRIEMVDMIRNDFSLSPEEQENVINFFNTMAGEEIF